MREYTERKTQYVFILKEAVYTATTVLKCYDISRGCQKKISFVL
jgi:hypothetical protein